MKKGSYYGYTVYENGKVVGLKGKEIKKQERNGRYEVTLTIEGKRRTVILARLVYYVFDPFDMADKNQCVICKDGDKFNVAFDNLALVHRKDLIHGQKHLKRSLLTDEQVAEIRTLYKGKSGVNQYDRQGHSLKTLADAYGVSKGNVMHIVKGLSRNKDAYKLR